MSNRAVPTLVCALFTRLCCATGLSLHLHERHLPLYGCVGQCNKLLHVSMKKTQHDSQLIIQRSHSMQPSRLRPLAPAAFEKCSLLHMAHKKQSCPCLEWGCWGWYNKVQKMDETPLSEWLVVGRHKSTSANQIDAGETGPQINHAVVSRLNEPGLPRVSIARSASFNEIVEAKE